MYGINKKLEPLEFKVNQLFILRKNNMYLAGYSHANYMRLWEVYDLLEEEIKNYEAKTGNDYTGLADIIPDWFLTQDHEKFPARSHKYKTLKLVSGRFFKAEKWQEKVVETITNNLGQDEDLPF